MVINGSANCALLCFGGHKLPKNVENHCLKSALYSLRSTNAQDEVYDDEVDNGGDEVYPPAVVGVPPILVQPTDTTRTSEPSSSPSPQRKPILVAQDAITPQKEGGGPRIPITTPKTATTTTTESTTTTTTTSATTISGQDSDSDDQKGKKELFLHIHNSL